MIDAFLTSLLLAFLVPPLLVLIALLGFTWTPWHRDLLSWNLDKRLYVPVADAAIDAEVDALVRWSRAMIACALVGIAVTAVLFFTLSPGISDAPVAALLLPAIAGICVGAFAAWPKSSHGGVAAPARLSDYIHPVIVYGLRALAVLNLLAVGGLAWLIGSGAFVAEDLPNSFGLQVAALALVSQAVFEVVAHEVSRRRRLLDQDTTLAADVRTRYLLQWIAMWPAVWTLQLPTSLLSSTRSLRDEGVRNAIDAVQYPIVTACFAVVIGLLLLSLPFARRIGQHMFLRLWPNLPLIEPGRPVETIASEGQADTSALR